MNISNGMSVISMGGVDSPPRLNGAKVYLWPSYGKNYIHPVRPVEPREPRIVMRASAEERERLLEMVKGEDRNRNRTDGNFSVSGTRFEPGLLFNALA